MKSFTIVASLVLSSLFFNNSIASDDVKENVKPVNKIEVITVTPNYILLDAMRAVSAVRAEVASKEYWKNEFMLSVKRLVEDQEAGNLLDTDTLIDVGAIDPAINVKQPTSHQGSATVEAGAI